MKISNWSQTLVLVASEFNPEVPSLKPCSGVLQEAFNQVSVQLLFRSGCSLQQDLGEYWFLIWIPSRCCSVGALIKIQVLVVCGFLAFFKEFQIDNLFTIQKLFKAYVKLWEMVSRFSTNYCVAVILESGTKFISQVLFNLKAQSMYTMLVLCWH